ncbi:MAG: hypothetical protein WDO19_20910 [Bacteroidota bacterium]
MKLLLKHIMAKMLVIDDETDTLMLIKRIFQNWGFQVITLSTGSRAVEIAENIIRT